MATPTNLEFVELSGEQIAALEDQQLAQAYMRAVLLNHRARMEGQRYARNRDAALPYPEQTQDLKRRMELEMVTRGKIWQVGLHGDTWLDDAPETSA